MKFSCLTIRVDLIETLNILAVLCCLLLYCFMLHLVNRLHDVRM